MAQSQGFSEQRLAPATSADVKSVFGDLDQATILAILDLRPTIMDLEQAAVRLSGDEDVFGAGEPLKGAAGEIIALLTAEEEEEPPPRP